VTAQDALLEAQLAQANEEFDRKIFHLRLLRFTGVLRETLEGLPPESTTTKTPSTRPTTAPQGPLQLRPTTVPGERSSAN
jgi:hypothetical protein